MSSAYNLVALHITKTVSSTLSIIGTSYIIQHVLRSKKRRQRVLTRLILIMSIMDLIFAITLVLGSIVIPKEAELPFPTKALGNWATCEAAGFLVAGSSHSSIMYHASLSIFYLLTIRYGWSEWKMQRHYEMEKCLHAIPLLIGWGLAIPGLPLNLYNPFPSGCAILSYPFQCEQRNPQPCQRGKHLGLPNFPDLYRSVFLLLIRCIVYVFLVVCMTLIYLKLNHIDSRSSSTRRNLERSIEMNNNNNNNHIASTRPTTTTTSATMSQRRTPRTRSRTTLNRLTRQFATQALLYCCAFFITWLFPTIGLFWGLVSGAQMPYAILLLSDLFTPLQGFWNAFIYLRPRYLRYRKRQREEEEQQRQAQEQVEARRMAQVARLLAKQGLAFVQAFSVQNDDEDDDEEDEDYLIILSNADEARILPPVESDHDSDFPCSTAPPLFNETSSTPLPASAVTTPRQSIETCTHEDEKMPEPSDDLRQ